MTRLVVIAAIFYLASAATARAGLPSPAVSAESLSPASSALSPTFSASEVPAAPADSSSPPVPFKPIALAASTSPGVRPPAERGYSLLDNGLLLAETTATRSDDSGTTTGGERWPYRKANIAEYVGVAVAAAGTLYFENKNGKPEKAKWKSRNAFDEGIRDAVRLESRDARDAAHMASNVVMAVMIAAPVFEPVATTGWRDKRWDNVWQTEMINLESFTFTSLVSSLMQNLIARERPFVRNCADGHCEDVQENRSMPSGHVAFAFTGAGLICTHHKYQYFYGDEDTDRNECAAALGLAAADGVLRLIADRHYMTDVLAGTAIGLFSGFILPRLLHYPWHSAEAIRSETQESVLKRLTLAPDIYSDGAGLTCRLSF